MTAPLPIAHCAPPECFHRTLPEANESETTDVLEDLTRPSRRNPATNASIFHVTRLEAFWTQAQTDRQTKPGAETRCSGVPSQKGKQRPPNCQTPEQNQLCDPVAVRSHKGAEPAQPKRSQVTTFKEQNEDSHVRHTPRETGPRRSEEELQVSERSRGSSRTFRRTKE